MVGAPFSADQGRDERTSSNHSLHKVSMICVSRSVGVGKDVRVGVDDVGGLRTLDEVDVVGSDRGA